jgi:hypothetical protein
MLRLIGLLSTAGSSSGVPVGQSLVPPTAGTQMPVVGREATPHCCFRDVGPLEGKLIDG